MDADQRPAAAGTVLVQHAGDEFFPRPALAPNQHRRFAAGHLADRVETRSMAALFPFNWLRFRSPALGAGSTGEGF